MVATDTATWPLRGARLAQLDVTRLRVWIAARGERLTIAAEYVRVVASELAARGAPPGTTPEAQAAVRLIRAKLPVLAMLRPDVLPPAMLHSAWEASLLLRSEPWRGRWQPPPDTVNWYDEDKPEGEPWWNPQPRPE